MIQLPALIMGMQQVVRFFGIRFFQVFAIDLLDIRIIMRCPYHGSLIIGVKASSSLFAHLVGSAVRLPDAADTAAAACHYFDKMIERLSACFD